eukprot:SAG31_NODE_1169_length_9565_cov_3.703571_8_plen_105_part_00
MASKFRVHTQYSSSFRSKFKFSYLEFRSTLLNLVSSGYSKFNHRNRYRNCLLIVRSNIIRIQAQLEKPERYSHSCNCRTVWDYLLLNLARYYGLDLLNLVPRYD